MLIYIDLKNRCNSNVTKIRYGGAFVKGVRKELLSIVCKSLQRKQI